VSCISFHLGDKKVVVNRTKFPDYDAVFLNSVIREITAAVSPDFRILLEIDEKKAVLTIRDFERKDGYWLVFGNTLEKLLEIAKKFALHIAANSEGVSLFWSW